MIARHEVGVRRYEPGLVDAHGNRRDGWAAAVMLPVFAIAPGVMGEPPLPNRDLSEVVFTLHVPAHPNMPGERDLVVLGGDEYAVDGRPQDWTRGPWRYSPGWVVMLKRTEG